MVDYEAVGRHLLGTLTGCDKRILDDVEALEYHVEKAIRACGFKPLGKVSHKFEPQGASVVILLEESHASIHTYPEHGLAFVDIFTCGEKGDPKTGFEYLAAKLDADESFHEIRWRS